MSSISPLAPAPGPPPLTLLPRIPGGAIPASLTPILGRDDEISQILQLLDRDDLRVVTLLGPGGVGKTRLAQEVAGIIEHDFAHGSRWAPLAAMRDPALVPKAVAQALGLQESGQLPAEDLLANMLAEQHLLLVLDNFEQVVEAAPAWLSGLLAKCPRLKVLVTSRIALHIAGEQRFIVSPLPVPEPGASDFRQVAALNLFAQRARAIDVNFAIHESNEATVAEICRRLDGLPLAIELAAARVNVLSPEAILARLSHRLDLLTGGRRDVDPRRRSMREAIGWSYDLLSDEEQRLFGRLSVFAGGFSLEAAAFVVGYPDSPLPEPVILDAINSLVDQSLVDMVDRETGPRFAMLETIREYGLAELQRDGHEDLAYCAHAEHCLALGARARSEVGRPHWHDFMESEFPNIRAASSWLTDHDRMSDAIELNVQILPYPFARGHTREARGQFESWLAHPSLEPGSRAHALALVMVGAYGFPAGDYANAHRMIDESIEIFRKLDDKHGLVLAMTCVSLAPPMESPGQIEDTISRISEGIELARKLGSGRRLGLMLGNLSIVHANRGDIETAHRLIEEVEQVGRDIGDQWLIAINRSDRCREALRTGDAEQAGSFAAAALHIYHELGDWRHAPNAEYYLGISARVTGNLGTASMHLDSALQGARATSAIELEVLILIELASLNLAQADLPKASTWMCQATGVLTGRHAPDATVMSFDTLARIAQAAGLGEQAARCLGAADGLLERLGTVRPWKHDMDAWRATAASLQESLGDAEFNRLNEEGRALSFDEALAESRAFVQVVAAAVPDHDGAEQVPVHRLSTREVEVLALMADGLSNAEIADRLFLSLRTVTSHVTGVLGKLDLTSRTAAVAFAIRQGIV